LQHALYRAARADPGRRFHALYDKVCRRDVLWRAWAAARSNNGAPGIDQVTLAGVEEYGVARLLDELASELGEGRYRPLPARRVMIPKPGTAELRPLPVPPVRDRIVQAAGEDRARGRSSRRISCQPASGSARNARRTLFISRKHRRSRAFGWRVLVTLSPDELGLIRLYGIVVAPRAGKPWRDKRNAGGERRR
jgi:hypothetical protein